MTEAELRQLFGDPAVEALRRQLEAGASPEVDVEQLEAELDDDVDMFGLLGAAEKVGWLKRVNHLCCPVEGCGRILDPDMVAAQQCPYCNTDYRESGDHPKPCTVYQSLGPLSRSTAWLIAIHGFNTMGAWQELFSWLVANLYRHRAPVLIYKYGLVRIGVLFRWRHRMLARQLGRKIQRAGRHAIDNQIDDPPDVIIHSFGSQLFRLILEMDEFKDLKFGRVIAVGSVIRPDFDWAAHIRSGRFEAVMNQCGGRDKAVPFAQFTIPGAGPAGRHGFMDEAAINVMESSYEHSSAFEEARLVKNLSKDGLWERFLRVPLDNFSDQTKFSPAPWHPVWAPVRGLSRAAAIGLVFAVFTLLASIAVLGGIGLLRVLGG